MIKRRTVLLGIAGIGGLPGFLAWRVNRSTDQDAVVEVLRKRLNYLQLDQAGLRQFAEDLAARHPMSSARLRILAAATPLYTRLALSGHNVASNGIRHGEERVVTLYLLSSDFFQSGQDEKRPVKYLGYYDPVRACGNPFARPVMLSSSTV
jgi:hypothetical protein